MLVCYIMRRKWSHARDLRPALPITNRLHRCLCLHGKSNPHGGIRTRTCPILSRMPLLLGYMGKNGGRRRTCSPGRFPGPISLAMSPGSLVRFTFQNWSPRKELHPDDEVRSLACCLLHHAERNGAPPRTRTG